MFDTASFYKNEQAVGQGIRDSGIPRDQVFVISKIWWDEVEDCEAACRRSLERLGMDYIDLYLIHWPIAIRDNGEDAEEGKRYERINIPMYKIWEQMEALVDKGLVKNIGVSNFNVQLLWDMLSYARIKPAFNEVELHPLNTQDRLMAFMKEQKIVPIAYCPLARGADTRKCPNVLTHPIVLEIAHKHNATSSQVLLAYGRQRGCVIIPKSTNAERQKENSDSLQITLSEDDIARLTGLNENHRICDNYPWMLGTSVFA